MIEGRPRAALLFGPPAVRFAAEEVPMIVRLLAAALAFAAGGAHAQENAAARSLAASCAACHGTDGRSVTQEVPSLAGLPREQIVAQMRAFRDGTRPASIMPQIAKGYSEAQVEALADYFARRPR
jgi:cytochrome subunit of sulfide dehydrogenase